MAKTNIAQPTIDCQFDSSGWPLNPATGQPYTRNEIVTDPSIPYPLHVDPANPGPYWARRTPDQLAVEQKRIAKKSKARPRRRSRRRTFRASTILAISGAEIQTHERGLAMADLVKRANGDEPESRSILVTTNGQTTVLEVPR